MEQVVNGKWQQRPGFNEVTLCQPARLAQQAVKPLQPHAAHPARRGRNDPGNIIKTRPRCQNDIGRDVFKMIHHPVFLARHSHSHHQDMGANEQIFSKITAFSSFVNNRDAFEFLRRGKLHKGFEQPARQRRVFLPNKTPGILRVPPSPSVEQSNPHR